MSAEPIVRLAKVAKFYGRKKIFQNLNLDLVSGDHVLITGANGAGKSTLLRILAGLCKPDAGNARLAPNTSVAYLGHATFLYPDFTAFENLDFQARINGIRANAREIISVLEKMALHGHAHEKARFFSRGMAQRLNFARILLLDASLILLDEPFTGLDITSRRLMRAALKDIRRQGRAMAMVSHDPQAERDLVDRVLLLENHKLVDTAPESSALPGQTND